MEESNPEVKTGFGMIIRIAFFSIFIPLVLMYFFGWIPFPCQLIQIKEFLSSFAGFMQAVVTAIFSYYLINTANKSNKLANTLIQLEKNKEKGIIRENALIVYYDLLLGLIDVTNLYIANGNRNIVNSTPSKMFFSNEWIKNVAYLKDELQPDEIRAIYLLYGDLLTLQQLLERNSSNEEVHTTAGKIVENVFKRDNNNFNDQNLDSIKNLLNETHLNIIKKIENVTKNDVNT